MNNIFKIIPRRLFSTQQPSFPQQLFDIDYRMDNAQKAFEANGIETAEFTWNEKKIRLYSLPLMIENQDDQNQENMALLSEMLIKNDQNQTSLLQIDPTFHIYEKRQLDEQLKNKMYYKDIVVERDELNKQNVTFGNNHIENLFDIRLLDFLKASSENYTPEQMKKYFDSFVTGENNELAYFTNFFSEENQENIDSDEGQKRMQELQEALEKHVFYKQEFNYDFRTPFLLQLLKGNSMYMADIPKIYQRIQIGHTMSLDILQDRFKQVLKTMKNDKIDKRMYKSMNQLYLSSEFQMPQDFYLYFLMQKALMEETCQSASFFIKNIHFEPIKTIIKHYGDNGYMKDSSLFEFLQLPTLDQDKDDDMMLEKHALLDVMFETEIWNEPYIENPFPYLTVDYPSLSDTDKLSVQKAFFIHSSKYTQIKEKLLS